MSSSPTMLPPRCMPNCCAACTASAATAACLPLFAANWYTQPQYSSPAALHAAILARCGQGRLESAALRYLLASAVNRQDAQLGLSALGAVRSVAVARGDMAPWSDSFVKSFVMVSWGRQSLHAFDGMGGSTCGSSLAVTRNMWHQQLCSRCCVMVCACGSVCVFLCCDSCDTSSCELYIQ
jgi:hypothetical protein